MADSKLTLQQLMKVKKEMDEKEKEPDVQNMPLEELGEMVLKAGRAHRGEKFKDIYPHTGYNEWVASHISEDPMKSPGMSYYAVYLRRRLEIETQETLKSEKASGKDGHQNPSKPLKTDTVKTSHVKMEKEPLPAQEATQWALPVEPFEDEESMSQWSKVEIVESEVAELRHKMGQMESLLGQIVVELQKQNRTSGPAPSQEQ